MVITNSANTVSQPTQGVQAQSPSQIKRTMFTECLLISKNAKKQAIFGHCLLMYGRSHRWFWPTTDEIGHPQPPPYGQRARREQITWPLITSMGCLLNASTLDHTQKGLKPLYISGKSICISDLNFDQQSFRISNKSASICIW